jgi:chorismate dehydratase
VKSLRIGCVKYLNARPLIYGWRGHVEFGHPSILCHRLARGDLDVALVSSFEFLRNPIYQIVDDVAIASDGPVYSVFVAHAGGTLPSEVELDAASATAVALLRYLIAEQGSKIVALDTPDDALSPVQPRRARLLIGDQAILFRHKFRERYEYWDLGQEWQAMMKVPFVYALWLIRPEVPNAQKIADQLREIRNQNLANIDVLIAREKDFDLAFCRSYYRHHLRFSFGDEEKEGLRVFHDLCVKHGLLPKRQIAFATV